MAEEKAGKAAKPVQKKAGLRPDPGADDAGGSARKICGDAG
jgi:hypothetical protein